MAFNKKRTSSKKWLGQRSLTFESLENRIVLSASSPAEVEVNLPPSLVVSAAINASLTTEEWVQSLTFRDFALLEPEQVQYLTTEQLAAIPNNFWLGQISDESRAALSATQVRSLNVANVRINLLTNEQIGWLLPAQIRDVVYYDLFLLRADQIPQVTGAQLAELNEPAIKQWSSAQRAALTLSQVQSLNIERIRITLLTDQQIGWLTSVQIQKVAYFDLPLLHLNQIPQISSAQLAQLNEPAIKQWSSAQRAALILSQVQSLDIERIRITLLTDQQIGWLTSAQIKKVAYFDLPRLHVGQISQVSSAQLAPLIRHTFEQWSSAQRAALTLSQVQSLNIERIRITLLTDQQIGWLTSAQIRKVAYYDLPLLHLNQIPQVSNAQLVQLNEPAIKQWSSAQRAALTLSQVQSLNIERIRITLLTDQQIGWLTSVQIQKVAYFDLPLLHLNQIPQISSAQLAQLNETAIKQWSSAQRAALRPSQVQSLDIERIRITFLTQQQVSWLTSVQIQKVAYYDLLRLYVDQITLISSAQLAELTTDLLANWNTKQRMALDFNQTRSLNIANVEISLLTAQQIRWLRIPQIQSVKAYQLHLLDYTQIHYLTLEQISSIPSNNAFAVWSEEHRLSLTPAQVQVLNFENLNLALLGPTQISYLTNTQIRNLSYSNFHLLHASQIPLLSTAQIASIPNTAAFEMWAPELRSSLTVQQVQSLATVNINIELLSGSQREWLTLAQLASLPYYEFHFLSTSRIKELLPSQIAGIPNVGVFENLWSAEQCAALTVGQIRSLDVANIPIHWLTDAQVSYLTIQQINDLAFGQWKYLLDAQVPLIPAHRFADFTDLAQFNNFGTEFHLLLTRNQLFELKPEILAYFTHVRDTFAAPTNYLSVTEIGLAEDGLANDPRTLAEYAAILELVPESSATHVAVNSGNWSDSATWLNGVVPNSNAHVLIPEDITVRFNTEMDFSISTLRIDGLLNFATGRNTLLRVDTIVVTTFGKLYLGTETSPISSGVTAKIVFPDATAIDTSWDPRLLSRGLVSRGQVRMFGEEVTPFAHLQTPPTAGSNTLVLSVVPTNWRVGDKLVLTGTDDNPTNYHSEERTILAIDGNRVTVDPLQYDHLPPVGYGLTVQVANLSRNVVLTGEGTDVVSQRPHAMFVHNPDVKLNNVQVTGFGRTDKTIPIGTMLEGDGLINARGRYAVHFHRNGVNPASTPAEVHGSVIVGSPGWGLVNHSSHVIMEDNVAYQVVGASFVTEDGNEIGAMRRNLSIDSTGSLDSILSRADIHDFGHGGHGFWLQGPGIELEDNISAGSRGAAFSLFTASTQSKFDAINLEDPSLAGGQLAIPLSSVPQTTFRGNIAYSAVSGLETWFHNMMMNDGQTVIDDFTSWNTRFAGIELHHTGHLLIKDALLIGNTEEYTGYGIFSNHYSHDITVTDVRIDGVETGIDVAQRRKNVIEGGVIKAVRAFYIEPAFDTVRTVTINGGIEFPGLTMNQLGGRVKQLFAAPDKMDFSQFRPFDVLIAQDTLVYEVGPDMQLVLFAVTQLDEFVPFPSSIAPSVVPQEYWDLSNEELFDRFGISYGGALVPEGAYYLGGSEGVYAY